MGLSAYLVSVDFSDLLALTLPYNRHHFDRVTVVTSSKDADSVIPICGQNRARVFVTDKFYERGADFNKWAALEEALDRCGRHGWICLMDVDTVWPKHVPGFTREIGKLYTPYRRMLYDLSLLKDGVPKEESWASHPHHPQMVEFAGYTQIFHSADPVLGSPPWHDTDWRHAGGADSFFQAKWAPENKIRPPFEVLHLGPAGQNWCGRAVPYVDGKVEPEADRRIQRIRSYVKRRRQGPDRFAHERLPPG